MISYAAKQHILNSYCKGKVKTQMQKINSTSIPSLFKCNM